MDNHEWKYQTCEFIRWNEHVIDLFTLWLLFSDLKNESKLQRPAERDARSPEGASTKLKLADCKARFNNLEITP